MARGCIRLALALSCAGALLGSPGCDTADRDVAGRPAQLDGGCSSDALFRYTDRLCGFGSGGGSSCTDEGDGRCYLRCTSDADCTLPGRPYCTQIGLFDGGDYNCNAVVFACREKRTDWCPDVKRSTR